MIKRIKFTNFRNLNGEYLIDSHFKVIFGKNNEGKTNFLDGLKIILATITSDYAKISISDFGESDDSKPFLIEIEFDYGDIPSLHCTLDDKDCCGAILKVFKTPSGKYVKDLRLLNGGPVDYEILREDPKLPKVSSIPLIRAEDIFSSDFVTSINNFIEKEEQYNKIRTDSKEAIKNEIKEKTDIFSSFCNKFGQDLKVEVTDPKFTDGKLYIVDGDKPHNSKIGSGYRSIANIILNTMDTTKYNIVLVDEIENHLHPSLLRLLIKELKSNEKVQYISTTHSPVVLNETEIGDVIDISGITLSSLDSINLSKIKSFLHPGRAELIFADNIILVEGYTEELILNNYSKEHNLNWTVINVAGVMFEPYIKLARLLNKKVIVISDNDISLSESKTDKSPRFVNLEEICQNANYKIIEIFNTLESDLYVNNILGVCSDMLIPVENGSSIMVAKKHKKTEIALKLIEKSVSLDDWHVIKEIKNEFGNN